MDPAQAFNFGVPTGLLIIGCYGFFMVGRWLKPLVEALANEHMAIMREQQVAVDQIAFTLLALQHLIEAQGRLLNEFSEFHKRIDGKLCTKLCDESQ